MEVPAMDDLGIHNFLTIINNNKLPASLQEMFFLLSALRGWYSFIQNRERRTGFFFKLSSLPNSVADRWGFGRDLYPAKNFF